MEQKQTHLIERAAARLRQATPDGSAGDRYGSGPNEFSPSLPVHDTGIAEERPRIATTALKAAGLMDWGDTYNRVAEEFRIVESKVLRQSFGPNGADANGGSNLVMITSALKGEGKSFTAINLAGEVARQGDRQVLLIDADGKPGGLGQLLGISAEPGLLDLAREGNLNVASVIIPTVTANLDVIPFGSRGERSGELVASRRMVDVVMEISRRYSERLVIFDAPPCLANSCPHTLAAVVGQVILVVAANSTQREDIEAALELIGACPHVSMLLNKVATWTAHSFGSFSYYPGTQA